MLFFLPMPVIFSTEACFIALRNLLCKYSLLFKKDSAISHYNKLKFSLLLFKNVKFELFAVQPDR